MEIHRVALCALVGALSCRHASAEDGGEYLFRNPSFDELANATVTSVTGTPLLQFATPAAVYTMTAHDVRSSGSRRIPDALRLVPGLQVAQFDAHTWAVTARGFNMLFPDKLLVLIDGRSVYAPLNSGVYWEKDGWLDPDLDRIEVVRGPGGSVWGANAVNGIVNIIGKRAQDSQGFALDASIGTQDWASGAVRYGGTVGEQTFYRVYADYQTYDDIVLSDGSDAGDGWRMVRGGIRLDRSDEATHFTFKGEAYTGDFDEAKQIPIPQPPFQERAPPGSTDGGYAQAVWSRHLTKSGVLEIDGWWEHNDRRLAPSYEKYDTAELQLRYRATQGIHALVVESGYRHISHDAIPTSISTTSPTHLEVEKWSVSAQDDIALAPNLTLTAGLRAEHNSYTGWEWQPTARVSWETTPQQTLWASIGRGVRTPNIVNEAGEFVTAVLPPGRSGPDSPSTIRQTIGNPDVDSEKMTAWEIGWRQRFHDQGSVSVSAFYNDYDNLVTYTALPLDTTTLAPDFWLIELMPVNAGSARAYGVEVSSLWLPLPRWQLNLDVAFLDMHVNEVSGQLVIPSAAPRWQASLRSSYEIKNAWSFGVTVRYVGELESPDIPSYLVADVRLARRFGDSLELALVGRDLGKKRHAEFRNPTYPVDGFVESSALVTLTWRR